MAAAPSRGDDHHHHGSRGGTSTSQHPAHSQHASAASVQLGRFVLWSLVEGGGGGGGAAAAAAANDMAMQPHSAVTSVAALAEPFTPPRATGGGPTQAGAGGGLRSSPIDLAKDLIRAKPRIPEPMALMQGRERSVMGAIPDVPTTVERRPRRRLHQQPDQQHRGFATTPPTRRKVAAAAAATANNTTTPQPQPPSPAALSTLHNQSAYDLPAARAIDDALGMLRDIAKLKGRAAQMLRAGRREDAATLGAAIEKTSAVVRERVKEARAAVRADAAQHLSTKEQLESAIRNMETERAITAREHAAAVAARMRAEAEKQAGAAEFAQMGTVAQRRMVEEQKRAIVGLQQAHSEEMAHLSSELELVRGEAARRERALADTVGKSESKCAELQASLSGVEAERHRLQVEVESFRCSKETLAKRLDSVEQARASAVAAQDAASATQARIAATWQSERDGLRSKIAECEEARLMAEQQSTSLSVTCAQLEQRASRLEQDLVKTKEHEAREAEDFKDQLASAEQHLDKIQLDHTTHVAELKQELLKTQTALASSEHG